MIFTRVLLLLIATFFLNRSETASAVSDNSSIDISLSQLGCSTSIITGLPQFDSGVSPESIRLDIPEKYGSNCKITGIYLRGEITQRTLPQLKFIVAVTDNTLEPWETPYLELDSPGGLISEAMKIGEFVAQRKMPTSVHHAERCFSACVLIYAAGWQRIPGGKIGIHRPFSTEISTESLSFSQYLEQYENLTPVLKKYYGKFGVSPTIVDVMNVVTSDNIKILSAEELELYGLDFENVAYAEYNKAKTIQKCGNEYYELKKRWDDFHISCMVQQLTETNNSNILDNCTKLADQKYPNFREMYNNCL
ncbi:hypothetical protein [Haliea sp. E17]|uniref:hypothetical protein n=1 Tax=Haliea sp. E17 TaxID=3401576 RepID=UPI003AAC37D4